MRMTAGGNRVYQHDTAWSLGELRKVLVMMALSLRSAHPRDPGTASCAAAKRVSPGSISASRRLSLVGWQRRSSSHFTASSA